MMGPGIFDDLWKGFVMLLISAAIVGAGGYAGASYLWQHLRIAINWR